MVWRVYQRIPVKQKNVVHLEILGNLKLVVRKSLRVFHFFGEVCRDRGLLDKFRNLVLLLVHQLQQQFQLAFLA